MKTFLLALIVCLVACESPTPRAVEDQARKWCKTLLNKEPSAIYCPPNSNMRLVECDVAVDGRIFPLACFEDRCLIRTR